MTRYKKTLTISETIKTNDLLSACKFLFFLLKNHNNNNNKNKNRDFGSAPHQIREGRGVAVEASGKSFFFSN